MNILLAVLFALAVAAPSHAGRSSIIPSDLSALSQLRDGPASGAGDFAPVTDPRWQETDFVVRQLPSRAAASALTDPRLERLSRIFGGNEPRAGIALPMPADYSRTVIFTVGRLNSHNPPLTGPEWDAKLDALSLSYQSLFPAGRRVSAAQWRAGMDTLCDSLLTLESDPHTEYYNREQMEELIRSLNNADMVGIGVHIEAVPEGLRVFRVLRGGPAADARLLAGDVITHADGTALSGLTLERASSLLRGAAGTAVRVRLARGADVTMTRRPVSIPNIFSRIVPGSDAGYIWFSGFDTGIAEAIVGARPQAGRPRSGGLIEDLRRRGARRIVIDVRHNGGGSVEEARLLVSEFLRDTARIDYLHAPGRNETAVTVGAGRYDDGLPLAILVDGYSASASEHISANLQEWGRALVVGAQTYGKGSFQGVLQARDGSGVRVTNGTWNTSRDRNVGGRFDPQTRQNVPGSGGVTPNVAVTLSEEQEAAVLEGIANQLYGSGGAAASDPALDAALRATWPSTAPAGRRSNGP